MDKMTKRTEYRILSGEGTGPGSIEKAVLSDIGARRRLTRERKGGRWARALYRLNDWNNVYIDIESGEARHF